MRSLNGNLRQREHFDADIARIDIVAVVSPDTVPGLGEGAVVKEFYLLAVQLKRREYDIQNNCAAHKTHSAK